MRVKRHGTHLDEEGISAISSPTRKIPSFSLNYWLVRVTRDHSSDVSYEYLNHSSLECFSVTVFPCLVISAWPKFIQVTLEINTGFLDKSVLRLVCSFSNSEKSKNESWLICWTRNGFACRAEVITSSHCCGTKTQAAALRFSMWLKLRSLGRNVWPRTKNLWSICLYIFRLINQFHKQTNVKCLFCSKQLSE